jgi:hypothetical protein
VNWESCVADTGRSVSIFLGRPVAMLDDTFNTAEPSNITDSELVAVPPNCALDRRSSIGSCANPFSQIYRPLDQPTKSTFLILHFRLAKIIGIVQSRCHGLQERRLADVYKCEELFKQFEACLPRHFRLDEEQVDTSLDHLPGFEWIRFQRLSLHSKYHLARVARLEEGLYTQLVGGSEAQDDYGAQRSARQIQVAHCECAAAMDAVLVRVLHTEIRSR